MKTKLFFLIFTITTTIGFAQTFTVDNINYNITSTNPNEVEVLRSTNVSADLVIPSNVEDNGVSYSVISIANNAFRNIQLTSVVIPNSVNLIGAGAFRNTNATTVTIGSNVATIGDLAFVENVSQTTIISRAIIPPTIGSNAIARRAQTNLTVPTGTEAAYAAAGWTGFFSVNGVVASGTNFTIDQITYEVTASNPNEVTVIDNTNTGAIEIPESVTLNTINFNVTAISNGAFRNNQLTSVTIPDSVISIGAVAFGDNPDLATVISNSTTPPTLGDNVFLNTSDAKSLTVLSGTEAAYLAAGWTGFFATNGVVSSDAFGQSFVENGITYEITDNNPNAVRAIENTNTGAIEIPALVTFNNTNFNVTIIGDSAFRDNQLTSVTIPDSVLSIGAEAFKDNPDLATVISNNTTPPTLGADVFLNTLDFIELTVPMGTESAYVATGWTGFFSINEEIQNVVTFITDEITYEVTAVNPNKVTVINNTNTGTIEIPALVTFNNLNFDVTAISNGAFINNQLTSVTIPNSVISIGIEAFRDNQLTSVTIPDSVISIGNGAFRDNSIISITLGSGLETIGDLAFEGNVTQTSIVSTAITPPTIGSNAIGQRQATNLTIPDRTEAAYIAAGWTGFFSINRVVQTGVIFIIDRITYEVTASNPNTVIVIDNTNTGVIEIPASVTFNTIDLNVTSIGNSAFRNNQLTSVTIPNSVITIAREAFRNNQLTSVTIPNSVISIADSAFRDNSIVSFTLGNGLESIGGSAFVGNAPQTTIISSAIVPPTIGPNVIEQRQVTNLIIPNGTETAYLEAGWTGFFAINSLVTDDFIGTTFIEDRVTYEITGNTPINAIKAIENTNTGVLEIPAVITVGAIELSVTTIEEDAFRENQLTSVIIPEGVVSIGDAAFFNNQLTSVSIPNTVTIIDRAAFQRNNLTSITIPGSVTTIVEDAFRENELTSVTFSEGLITIGDASFFNNQITNINIPNSVTVIERAAFQRNAIETLSLGENVTSIGDDAFRENDITEVTLPDSITSIGRGAFSANVNLQKVTALGTTPAQIVTGDLVADSFRDRSIIDLFVPIGTTQAYLDAGWTGFKSITEATFDSVLVAPRVFLQGTLINPNPGEEDLMRDDLLLDRLIPSTSPYRDEAISTVVLSDTIIVGSSSNIVDWVFVQLRDANDRENVVAERSALLQRDGDVVATNGFSTLSFTLEAGDYFIAIEHRNHLGILSANAIALSSASTAIDFTADPSVTEGGENALVEIRDGVFAMVAGDSDENGQIQPSDVNATTAAIGTSSYSNADVDMNGQIQPADVNNLVNPNIGRGIQFLARSILSVSKSDQKNIEFIYMPKAPTLDKKPAASSVQTKL